MMTTGTFKIVEGNLNSIREMKNAKGTKKRIVSLSTYMKNKK